MRLYEKLPTCERSFKRFVLREGHGVEHEVGALLYAVVRLLKPDVCFESGLFIGDSAEWIGKALADNGYGHLHTCDVDANRIEPGRMRLMSYPVTVHHCRGEELLAKLTADGAQLDFAHVDSGSQQERKAELLSLDETKITPLGVVAFHDACIGYEELYPAMAEARTNWPHLVFPSLIGVAIFQRPE